MGIQSSESDGIYRVNYCSTCDASPFQTSDSGVNDNPFLLALGQLQRSNKADLILGSCITCKGVLWHVKFILE